jgi:FixJ family two-component response regulator
LTTVPVISIIDDDASVRLATNNLVRSIGYVAHTFASAEEFLLSTEMNDTSCIIADVQMPEMTGVELQSLLRSRGSRIPFIFITAYPEERIRTQVLHAGATCFLSKPFDGITLIKYLDAALDATVPNTK